MFKKKRPIFPLFLFIATSWGVYSQESEVMTADESEDLKSILEEAPSENKIKENQVKLDKKTAKADDELNELVEDLGGDDSDVQYQTDVNSKNNNAIEEVKVEDLLKEKSNKVATDTKDNSFDPGREEKELLEVAKKFQVKISDKDWNKLLSPETPQMYQVLEGDWLFKISKKFFGTGFYYPKIWALNPYITNPHLIEPGMTLVFTTGSENKLPDIRLGTFSDDEKQFGESTVGVKKVVDAGVDDKSVQEKYASKWLEEKQKLINQGVFITYASDKTLKDILNAAVSNVSKEYKMYQPPDDEMNPQEKIPETVYDEHGFDRKSKIFFNYKEGFFLNTFLSTNVVQDLGKIENSAEEKSFFTSHDHIYVTFDSSLNIMPGDRFSIYTLGGKVEHQYSDRVGQKYTIVGQLRTIEKKDNKWRCIVEEAVEVFERGARVTNYIPKIDVIKKTFNDRKVEALISGAYNTITKGISFGDVVYLDRGRADGIEMGNVFDVYDHEDRLLKRKITGTPTYKTGELVVITLTDNFATALVVNSSRDFKLGDLAMTKSKLEAAKTADKKNDSKKISRSQILGNEALDELDVELNLDGLNDDLLGQADKVQFTEEELSELERVERKKSVIRDSERDLKVLERLEKDIEQSEAMVNEAKLDEDKLLEEESLEKLEDKNKTDEFDVEDIEENIGKLYLDEKINDKDNPYGLTEFDLEEVDELLNAPKGRPDDKK